MSKHHPNLEYITTFAEAGNFIREEAKKRNIKQKIMIENIVKFCRNEYSFNPKDSGVKSGGMQCFNISEDDKLEICGIAEVKKMNISDLLWQMTSHYIEKKMGGKPFERLTME